MLNYILEITQGLKVTDFIDIGIIATVIYLLLIWFKRARARFIFFGMLILGVVYILARLFGLYLTTIAFQAFYTIALIAVLIIFQDDIRHLFERIGIWGVSRKRRLAISFTQDTEILSSALAGLSRKKIGALVVVPGKDPLERHLEVGINLEGVVSKELLESIFDPHSPGHDGAVILKRDQVIKFGCHLPLSTNIKEIGRLGTRHAAALGLAERTDALCIVVSEEEGTISVAEEGRMRQLKDAAELPLILENFYRKNFPKREKGAFRSFLTEHFIEKIIAIIFACGLWFIFGYGVEVIRRDFIVPVEYRNLAQDIIIKEPKAKEVTVALSGSAQKFSLFNPEELKVSLDMARIKDGENVFSMGKDLIRTPSGISVVDIEPREITITAYRMIPVMISINLNTEGRAPSGLNIREIKVIPKEISVTVPSIMPKDKISIATEPVDLKTITQTTTLIPKLIIPPEIRFPGDKYPEVTVTIEVENTGQTE
jgi:uncharacterized protein (TIGR00159 family)